MKPEKLTKSKRGRTVRRSAPAMARLAAVSLLVLGAVWVLGFGMMRVGEGAVAAVESATGGTASRIEWSDKDMRGLTVVSRPVIGASGTVEGHLLVGGTSELPTRTWLARLFGAPKRIDLVLYVDSAFAIQGLWAANTSNPAVVGSSWNDVKLTLKGISGFLVLGGFGGRTSDLLASERPLSDVVTRAVRSILGVACRHQYDARMAELLAANSTGSSRTNGRLPYIAAYDINGKIVTSDRWAGRPVIVVTVNPACGHCIAVVAKAQSDARVDQPDCVQVVVLRAPADAGLSTEYVSSLPASTIVLPDESGDISAMLGLEPAPSVAVVKADGSLVGIHSAYSLEAVHTDISDNWDAQSGH